MYNTVYIIEENYVRFCSMFCSIIILYNTFDSQYYTYIPVLNSHIGWTMDTIVLIAFRSIQQKPMLVSTGYLFKRCSNLSLIWDVLK